MKKILFICPSLFLLDPASVHAQCFDKGYLIGEAGAGFGFYTTSAYDKTTKTTSNDTSGTFFFPLTVEYGMTKRFGLGGTFKYSNYIEGDSSGTLGVNGFDLVVRPAYHFIARNRFGMNIRADIGGTYISYRTNDVNDAKATGAGLVYGLGAAMNFFFTDKFGMYLAYDYTAFAYKNLKLTDNTGNETFYELSFKGSNFGLGLVFRLN